MRGIEHDARASEAGLSLAPPGATVSRQTLARLTPNAQSKALFEHDGVTVAFLAGQGQRI
jgi:hypothetical protein